MLLYCISPQIGFQTYPNFVKCNERLLRANDLPKVLERGKNITFCFNRVELEMLMRRSIFQWMLFIERKVGLERAAKS